MADPRAARARGHVFLNGVGKVWGVQPARRGAPGLCGGTPSAALLLLTWIWWVSQQEFNRHLRVGGHLRRASQRDLDLLGFTIFGLLSAAQTTATPSPTLAAAVNGCPSSLSGRYCHSTSRRPIAPRIGHRPL